MDYNLALEAELQRLYRIIAEYEEGINWGVSCLNCAKLLTQLYEAESKLEQYKNSTEGSSNG